uniref:recombinase family protein n=1 Tax=Clostridium perfringens TaxID=1502 RepID=UPI0039E758BC
MNRWFYYVRVSSKSQKLDRQEENPELDSFCKRMGIREKEVIILADQISGKTFERPNYQLLKKIVTEGDNIIVSSLDRFGRNYLEGRKEFTELIAKGVKVYVLNRPMLEDLYKLNDTMSKFMINFLVDWELISAEEELKRIKERQREGLE